MAHTKKLNDNCYFNTLCNDSKSPGNYMLNTIAHINSNQCYPTENPRNLVGHINNVDIENNLFNLDNKSTKCLDGNTLNDKNSRVDSSSYDAEFQFCDFNVTNYTKNDLNNSIRGNFNSNVHPIGNNPYGSNLDYFNDGRYGIPKCSNNNDSNCYIFGNNIQSRIGINTTLNAKDNHLNNINLNSNLNNELNHNIEGNNINYDNSNISDNCLCFN